jgi:hypothetical protein
MSPSPSLGGKSPQESRVIADLSKASVALLFLSVAAAAAAQWAQVSKDDFSTIYMDPATKKVHADGIVSIDALTDYDPTSPQAGPFRLSEKGLSEIESVLLDCANHKYSSRGGAWREGQMGNGKITKTYPPKEAWSKVPAFYDGLFAATCQPK